MTKAMNKANIEKVVRDTCKKYPEFDRIDKWKIFCRVCDNALGLGYITDKQHKRWTDPF